MEYATLIVGYLFQDDRKLLILSTQLHGALPAAWIEWIGFTAATCTTLAFLPQLFRVWRLKSAHDISFPTFLLFSVGEFLWTLYGVYAGSRPVILANVLTFIVAMGILVLKFRYDRKP